MRNPLRRRLPHIALLLSCLIWLSLWLSPVAPAADVDTDQFVVESEVTLPGQSKAPLQRTTTLFVDGVAYDIVHGNPAEVARFDFQNQVVDLASRSRRLRTQLSFDELRRFEAALRARAQRRLGLGTFLANPHFAKEFDAKQKTLKLTSPWLSYEAQVTDARADVVERITMFADWSVRLGTMLSPMASPMPARLELNLALKKQNWRAVRITRRGEARARYLGVIHSQHKMRSWRDSDPELIREIEKNLKDFPSVSFSEFRTVQISARPATKK